jgi:lysophospholipase L1-like esterase
MTTYPILAGKKILFLGSSVTEGSGAGGISFADILAKQDGIIAYKEAIGGTTLADINDLSYVARLKKGNLPQDIQADAFVCQLSTNDAGQNIPYEKTEAAIREICAFVRKVWSCPIYFYTGTYFENEHYEKLVEQLEQLAVELHFEILNLWRDTDMRSISSEAYSRYMNDPIHPNLLGYTEWWTPKFEQFLAQKFSLLSDRKESST